MPQKRSQYSVASTAVQIGWKREHQRAFFLQTGFAGQFSSSIARKSTGAILKGCASSNSDKIVGLCPPCYQSEIRRYEATKETSETVRKKFDEPSDLSECEWWVIEPLLPNKPPGVPRVDDRRVLNGIFWVLQSGSPWRDLPERYGPHTTCYNRFRRWSKAGVWDRLMDAVTDAHGDDRRHVCACAPCIGDFSCDQRSICVSALAQIGLKIADWHQALTRFLTHRRATLVNIVIYQVISIMTFQLIT